jgi:transposase
VIGEESLLPVYYRILPGNISDVKTVKKMVIDSKFLKLDNVKFVMDRGCYDLKNLKQFLAENISFIVGGKKNVSFIESCLLDSISLGNDHQCYLDKYNVYGRTYEEKIAIIEKNKTKKLVPINIHIICDLEKAAVEKNNFHSKLNEAVDAVCDNSATDLQKKLVDKYCEIKFDRKSKQYDLAYRDELINEKTAVMGYFCLLSDTSVDLNTAVRVYRNKDTVEKAFHVMKSSLSRKRTTQMHRIDRIEGHTFLKFVGLILRSAIHKIMDDNNIYKQYTMDELLSELDVIQKYIYPNTPVHYSEITKKQYDIYRIFNINPPDQEE